MIDLPPTWPHQAGAVVVERFLSLRAERDYAHRRSERRKAGWLCVECRNRNSAHAGPSFINIDHGGSRHARRTS